MGVFPNIGFHRSRPRSIYISRWRLFIFLWRLQCCPCLWFRELILVSLVTLRNSWQRAGNTSWLEQPFPELTPHTCNTVLHERTVVFGRGNEGSNFYGSRHVLTVTPPSTVLLRFVRLLHLLVFTYSSSASFIEWNRSSRQWLKKNKHVQYI